MYPTIMASCNINPHSFTTRKSREGEEEGAVKVYKNVTEVCIGGVVAIFDNTVPSVMSRFMSFLIAEREACKTTLPMYAKSIKVLSNSVYGSLGYSNSTLYSPTCAAAITAIGRHCIKLARRFFIREGLLVIYGDTDSCMVKGSGTREETAQKASRALDKLHGYFSSTSLHMMRMEVEAHYSKGIMTDKKRYCMLLTDGSMKKVGISLSRKDVSGICRLAALVTIEALFMVERSSTIDHIAKFVSAVSGLAVAGSLTLSDVSRYTKRDGMNCYVYKQEGGGTEVVPEDEAVLGQVVDCDIPSVMKAVAEEIERFTIPCRLGSVSDVMRASTTNAW
jgi:DNA polymerase elongation subunit (family B)